MKNFDELHIHHKEITSDALFLKKEIEFLLKILRNCYSTSINLDKIKLLDSYWRSFEQNIDKLDLLLKRIRQEEKSMSVLYQEGSIDLESTLFGESAVLENYRNIEKEVKLLKESFYEYMHGCNACALKTP